MALSAKGVLLSTLANQSTNNRHDQEALRYLSKAMAALNFKRQQLMEGASRESLSNKTILLYEQFMEVNLEASRTLSSQKVALENIFQAVERSKSMTLYESMASSQAFYYAGIPEITIQSEKALRQRISDLEIQRNRTNESGDASDTLTNELNSQIFDLRKSYAALLSKVEKDYPAYFQLKYGLSVVSLPTVQTGSHPNQHLAGILHRRFHYLFICDQ